MISNHDDVVQSKKYLELFDNRTMTLEQFKKAVRLKNFRLGAFYHIMDAEGQKVKFRRNQAQTERYVSNHQRDIILKARQLGFTTDKMISDLDDCLFVKNHRAGCIAHNDSAAKDIYRNKIRYAYRNIKPSVIQMLRLIGFELPVPVNDKDNSYVFSNGSSIGVSTGFRGGTLQSLHISEFGKICRKFPDKAEEIVTGAFPACSGKGATITIESTAEGKSGYFFKYCQEAQKIAQTNGNLTSKTFKFHFFPWWKDQKYTMDEDCQFEHLSPYFDELQHKYEISLTDDQKRWYASEYAIQGDKMKQEFPSTPEEAFAQAIEGAYYADQFNTIYKEGRYLDKNFDNDAKVHTAWDIGVGDSTSIWFYQLIGNEIHIINYLENSGEPLGYYIKEIESLAKKYGWSYGKHHAPHDINHRDWSSSGKTRKEQAREGVEYGGKIYRLRFEEVPKLGVDDGIEHARTVLGRCVFFTGLGGKVSDEKGSIKSGVEYGVTCLESYRKEWNDKLGCWRDRPLHDWSSHGSDAFRYLAVAENKRVVGFRLNRQ